MTNADKYLKDGEELDKAIKNIRNDINLAIGAEGFEGEVLCDKDDLIIVLNTVEELQVKLQSPVKPTLTEDEKAILRQLDKWFITIGKTEHGCIMIQDKCQGNEKHFVVTFDLLFAELFKWIKPRRRI